MSAHAATAFRSHSCETIVAFFSRNGLFATDGFTTWPLAPQINWSWYVSLANLSQVYLINNPDDCELQLYLPGPSGVDKKLHFNYHPTHVRSDGTLAVSGPTTVHNSGVYARAAVSAVMPDGSRRIFTAYANNDVYYDDLAASIPGNLGVTITTRTIYAAGMGNEWKLNSVLPFIEVEDVGTSFKIQPTIYQTNKVPQALPYKTITTPQETGLYRLVFGENTGCEGMGFTITEVTPVAGDLWGITSLILNGEGFGQENAPK